MNVDFKITSLFIAIFIMLAFYGFFIWGYKLAVSRKTIRFLLMPRHLAAFFMAVIAGLLLCVYQASQNEFVYFWDYGYYWTVSYNLSDTFFAHPVTGLRELYSSIIDSDYNLILPMIISLPIKIIGKTFIKYVSIIYIFFAVPVWFMMISLLLEACTDYKEGYTERDFIRAFVYTICFSSVFLAVLNGFADVAGMIPVIISSLIFFRYDPLEFDAKNIKKDVCISLNLMAAFFFRRYFAYYVFGYASTVILYTIYKITLSDKQDRLKVTKNALKNGAVIVVTALFVMLVFWKLAARILKNNYAEQYTGYNADLPDKLYQVAVRFGVLVLAAVLAGIFSGKRKKVSLYCLFSAGISMAFFFGVQEMDTHHTYVVMLQVFTLCFIGLNEILEKLKSRKCAVYASYLIMIMQPAAVFSEKFSELLGSFGVFFMENHSPLVRGDIKELNSLRDYLNCMNRQSEPVYVLASSRVLNSSIMGALDKPYSDQAVAGLEVTYDVDMRDGFPTHFLSARYVVVASPVQVHLAEGTQEIIAYLYEQITEEGSFVNVHYQKLSQEFYLDGEVTACVYVRIDDYTDSDKEKIAEYYELIYPDNADLFRERIFAE